MSHLQIRLPRGERSIIVPPDQARRVLTELLRQADLPLNTRCGQRGDCDGCCIEFLAGTLAQKNTHERLNGSGQPCTIRGCEHYLPVGENAEIRVPARSLLAHMPQVVTSFRINVPRAHDPLWQGLKMDPGQAATREQIAREIAADVGRAGLPVTVAAGADLLAADDDALVAVALEHLGDRWSLRPLDVDIDTPLGIAIDVGTTTVGILLVNLLTGDVVAKASDLNAQTRLGDNVVTRISLCANDKGMTGRLQATLVRQTLRPLIKQVLTEVGASSRDVVCVAVAGNMTMLHLLIGVDPTSIGVAPFTPSFLDHRVLPSVELPWRKKPKKDAELEEMGKRENDASAAADGQPIRVDANVHLLPGIAGYIGADISVGMFACGMAYRTDTCLLVDAGTNGEIVLKHKETILACATAAGPAFEGAGLSCGVRAGDGAISHIRLTGDPFEARIETIGDVKPIGLCGTAYVDFVAQARRIGLVSPTGRFVVDHCGAADIEEGDYGGKLTIAHGRGKEPIYVSEGDIASLLQAKAAIAAGIICLLNRVGLDCSEVDTLYLAGGFGFHMDVENVIACGLLPGFRTSQIELVGNTALAGAYLALVDSNMLQEVKRMIARVETVELNLDPNFETCYVDQLSLPTAAP